MQKDSTKQFYGPDERTDHSAPQTKVSFPGENSRKTPDNEEGVRKSLNNTYDFPQLHGTPGTEIKGDPLYGSLPKGVESVKEYGVGDKKQLK